MPITLEQYIAHFNEADAAVRKVTAGLRDLSAKVTQAIQNPQILIQPAKWPTQDELRALQVDAQTKSATLMAEYNQLPPEFRQYAPQPGTVGHSRP